MQEEDRASVMAKTADSWLFAKASWPSKTRRDRGAGMAEEVEAEDASLVDDEAPMARVGQLTAKEMVAAPGPSWKLHNGGGGLNSH